MGMHKELLELTSSKAIKNGRRLDELERRIKQLECPHNDIKFVNYYLESVLEYTHQPNESICNYCGKVIASFDTKKQFLEAKKSYHLKKAEEIVVED